MAISWKISYINSNPGFALIRPGSRPKLQRGQMSIVYECLEKLGNASLRDLVRCCEASGYRELLKPEISIEKSILYHLKRLNEGTVGRIKNSQKPVIREI